MSDSSKDIFAKLAAGKQQAQQTKTTTTTRVDRLITEKEFKIEEADIKSNPVYVIITDESLTDQQKIEKLYELKKYNAELTEEENLKNRDASNQFLLYAENQLMTSSQKGIEFTNDNAFALYDETIKELFSNIKTFKGYIEPFVQALQVLQKARDADISANQLIEAVTDLQDHIAKMRQEKAEKVSLVYALQAEIEEANNTALGTTAKLENLEKKLDFSRRKKAEAKKSWNIFAKGSEIKSAEADIKIASQQIAALGDAAKSIAKSLDDKNAAVDSLKAEIEDLDAKIDEAETEFKSNEDTVAIATLVEITGKDFKEKRENVVNAAQQITEKAIEGIEKSISRFNSGKEETSTQLNTVNNLNTMISLVSSSDQKVRVSDADFVSRQRETIDRIKAEKGEDAIYDPDFEIAKNHLDAANSHVEDVIASAARAVDLEGKLTRQSGTFKGLRDAYIQKSQDATRLRTSAAVEIPSQLAVTVKSVEMATATESNNMVNDAFADLSRTTRQSVTSIFDTVSAGAGHNNEQLRKTLESTLQTIDMMSKVEADLKAKAKEGYELRQDLDKVQSSLKDITEVVASAGVDADHEAMTESTAKSE